MPVRKLVTAVLCSLGPAVLAQGPTAAPLPQLSGVWAPSDPARTDELFNVGLTPLPGDGRLTIEHRADKFTVTMTMPDHRLDPILRVVGPFYQTVVYRVPTERSRHGGFGAGGPEPPTAPTWLGDALVVPDARPATRPLTTTYALEGDQLKVETRATLSPGRASTVTEWFKRIQ